MFVEEKDRNRYKASSMEELLNLLTKDNQLLIARGVIKGLEVGDEYHAISMNNPTDIPVTNDVNEFRFQMQFLSMDKRKLISISHV